MKYGILILILLTACYHPNPNGKVIASKAYSLEPAKKLQPCICMYEYWYGNNNYLFEDSCNKYNIGDTIK